MPLCIGILLELNSIQLAMVVSFPCKHQQEYQGNSSHLQCTCSYTFTHTLCSEGQFSATAYTLPQEDFVITIPDDMDVFACDIGNFTIWCRQASSFFTTIAIDGNLFVSVTELRVQDLVKKE
jgi:hypothetical protein